MATNGESLFGLLLWLFTNNQVQFILFVYQNFSGTCFQHTIFYAKLLFLTAIFLWYFFTSFSSPNCNLLIFDRPVWNSKSVKCHQLSIFYIVLSYVTGVVDLIYLTLGAKHVQFVFNVIYLVNTLKFRLRLYPPRRKG